MFILSILLLVPYFFSTICYAVPVSVPVAVNTTATAPVYAIPSSTIPVSVPPLSTVPVSSPPASTASTYVPPVPITSAYTIPNSTVDCSIPNTCNARLWNATGPDIRDVRQVHQNDCWWKAVQVSVTHHAKNRIMNFFFDPSTRQSYADKFGDALWAPNPVVQLYNPFTLQPEYFDTNITNRDLYDDKGPQEGVFWPDAMTQAMRMLSAKYGIQGYNYTSDGLDEGRVGYGPRLDTTLTILTGKMAYENKFSDYASSAQLYALLEQSIYTPMLFVSVPEETLTVTDPPMKDRHVYPIISTYYNTTTNAQMVHTRNVWGRTDNFTMADVWANGENFVHLRDYDRLT